MKDVFNKLMKYGKIDKVIEVNSGKFFILYTKDAVYSICDKYGSNILSDTDKKKFGKKVAVMLKKSVA